MKKLLLSLLTICLGVQQANSCAWYDPDSDYFNLFAQEIVQKDAYYPFLFTLNSQFYNEGYYDERPKNAPHLLDESIENWVSYFDDKLTYEETDALVKVIDRKHLYNWKKGELTHVLSKKLGASFYQKYQEGLAYLTYAKYLAPYMKISYVPSDNWHNQRSEDDLDVTHLDYHRVMGVLVKSYGLTQSRDIKLRYGYQMVRLNHYFRKYQEAIDVFNLYVAPLKADTPMYWYALDQMAGAQRGLGLVAEANMNFLKVFIHSKNRKKSAYASINLNDQKAFDVLLDNAQTKEEKNMAYFLLAYNNYSNPIYFMREMMKIDPDSDILKVLTVRSLDQLERNYLPLYIYCDDQNCEHKGKRLPLTTNARDYYETFDFINELKSVIQTARTTSQDNFWDLSLAHIYFLEKDYDQSNQLLNAIQTDNKVYRKQINQMLVLNKITAQPKIDDAFERSLMRQNPELFILKSSDTVSDTQLFVADILANRYFLQKDLAKSFLMNNKLSALQYNPDLALTKALEEFLAKKNKNPFENWLMTTQNDMGDPSSFFYAIYGDHAMRNADFDLAIKFYLKADNYQGIKRDYYYDRNSWNVSESVPTGEYDGFNNIPKYIFGQEKWVSYESPDSVSMKVKNLEDFPFIHNDMNKLELAKALQQLDEIGKGRDLKAKKANELIGNVLYNTTKLGYYRHIFVMDINNANGPKFEFNSHKKDYQLYYKNYGYNSYISDDNFDLAIKYYKKALRHSRDKEDKANIIFQMAKAEQGKYYNWEGSKNWYVDWMQPNADEIQKQQERQQINTKNKEYRDYFTLLKKKYPQTQTVRELRQSCSYFNHFMLK